MAYLCVGLIDQFCVSKNSVKFFVKNKFYQIVKEGEEYFLITLSNQKFRLKNFTINSSMAVLITEEYLLDFDMCEDLEQLK